MNLVGNAIKFTEQGGVSVISRITNENGKPQLAIDVTDTGIGISESAIKSIFDPFSQADTSITRRFGGTGLGLAISLQLAEAMGGEVTVSSTPGEGSTFTVTIDTGSLDGIQLLSAAEAQAASERVEPETQEVRTLPPGKVLVADDGEANLKLLKLVLGRAGMTVVTVENGLLAVEAARAEEFDIVLMDMQMPVMDGYTATATLREEGFTLPIVALTANVMQTDETKCRDAGCSGFLPKPIDMDDLFTIVAEQMGVEAGTVAQPPKPDNEEPKRVEEVPPTEPTSAFFAPTHTAVPAEPETSIPMQPTETIIPIAATKTSELLARGNEVGQSPRDTAISDDTTEGAVVVEKTVDKILEAIQTSLDKEDYSWVANLATSLNESAAVLGLDTMVVATTHLELAARNGRMDDCRDHLAKIIEARAGSNTSADSGTAEATEVSAEPVRSTLPTEDPEFLEIVVDFVAKLHEKLEVMRSAFDASLWEDLAGYAHWLRGSGGTAGFHEFTNPSRDLEKAVKAHDFPAVAQSMEELQAIANRIEVPEAIEASS